MNKDKIQVFKNMVRRLTKFKRANSFEGSAAYWELRYSKGGNSGHGSYEQLAKYKATVLNAFVAENNIRSVIEFGCGDGNQLTLATYPSYIGLDVAVTAIIQCQEKFNADNTKSFYLYNSLAFEDKQRLFNADLTLSLDVTYHLIEQRVYEAYLSHLFDASDKYVIIYAWDIDGQRRVHVMHRKFTDWVSKHKQDWTLLKINSDIPKVPDACDFFIFQKKILK